jgi:outer membrane protein assembly factor BamD (BamD/ComL family)
MKLAQSYILAFAFSFVLVACGNEDKRTPAEISREEQKETWKKEIADLEEEMASSKDSLPRTVATDLLAHYVDYINAYHNDSLSPRYTYEAANVAAGLGKFQKSIELLSNYHEGYPNAKDRDKAVYLIGFLYDSQLHDDDKAIKYYNKVIELYPNSPYAQQAKDALQWVGLSDEEILKKIEEINK